MHRQRYNPIRLLRNASIKTKLIGMVMVFLLAITGVIAIATLAFQITSGVRGYIIGEGLWSKSQKDAVYYASRYLHSGEDSEYLSSMRAISMMQGDRRAREEMSKPVFDPAIVTEGLVTAGVSPVAVPPMIFLFRNFRDVGFFASAIQAWTQADVYADQLLEIVTRVRAATGEKPLDPAQLRAFLDRIDEINAGVTPLEMHFSETLGAGARKVQIILFAATVTTAISLLVLGVVVSWLIARDINSSIEVLRDGAVRVARGDLDHRIGVRSHDELGELAMVFNDMIERRHDVEIALTTANEFREKVMESSTNAIYTMDMDGRFMTANRRTCEITGYPIEELIGLPWANMILPEHLPNLLVRYADTVAGRSPILNYEVPLIQKDGMVVTIRFSVAALSRDGLIFGVVGTAEDITDRKLAEQALISRADELARSNQELEQFAYVASHDLQEPLRTVSGFAQLLARRYQAQLGPEADEYIHFVTSGVLRMKSLIEDLLSYSRMARDPAAKREIDLTSAVNSALANVQGAIDAAGAVVICEPLPTLVANRQQMVQLFQNLIGNAVKFRSNSPPIIHISAEQRDQEWQITVRDNGIGISARHAQQVFVLFQRLHGRDKYPGNGIGLTICKKIVDLHGGRIWVAPSESGAVFRFTLRRTAAQAQAA